MKYKMIFNPWNITKIVTIMDNELKRRSFCWEDFRYIRDKLLPISGPGERVDGYVEQEINDGDNIL